MILGGGPNRIGQGIEFDYCCVHASFALREKGMESIMVNSNPETVSTDYDTSDKLYFEPLTREDVLNIIETEKPVGVIVQFGGQTPAEPGGSAGQGRGAYSGHPAREHRPGRGPGAVSGHAEKAGPAFSRPTARPLNVEEATVGGQAIGYPVMVRPSYVLGGRAMKIVYNRKELENFTRLAIRPPPSIRC